MQFGFQFYRVHLCSFFQHVVRERFRVRVRRVIFNVSDPGIELGDSVCDFEKVLPDQLCPSALKEADRFTRSIPRQG